MNENKNNEKNASFTCSSQVLAYSSGMLIFAGFGIFCIGYSIGYRSALRESLRGIQKESLAQEVYANAFFINDQSQIIEDSNLNQSPEDESISQETDSQLFTARLIGYPETHKKQAIQFTERWKKRGITLIIKEYNTNKAKSKPWFQVILEPNNDKMQTELLANIISKEENLADVIVELYSSEEKTV